VSYLLNDRSDFADEMVEGFVSAHPDLVRRVEGGVARRTRTPAGEVALVIGGGSGHYPAFAGLVGTGLAHGAALGNVFASPSAQQVCSVARAVAADAGVLLAFGNYAGDVLNFTQAKERLVEEGIAARTIAVTDDISSAPASERHHRRGVAGDMVVFRAAAWAAEQGRALDDVWALAAEANERTRTLGVAFSGCTLPGAEEPLFTVPPGRMALGMGIHGEPGLEELPMPTADTLADLLVSRLLDEFPAGEISGRHVAVILNGLGAVKSDELFVTYRRVAALLGDAGVTVVRPEVGELVTSFEMAGVSLTLGWLDDELEAAWTAPAETPAYRRGVDHPTGGAEAAGEDPEPTHVALATAVSQLAAGTILAALRAIAATIDENAEELGRLDAVAGDGDHGIGMQRGANAAVRAAQEAVEAGAGAGTTLRSAGEAWAGRGGGTSGALWGTGLRAAGDELGDQAPPDAARVVAGVTVAAEAVAGLGKAGVGDKTMVDAMAPFTEELRRRVADGDDLAVAWSGAARAATDAAQATAELLPRIGRARPHAQKSVGTPDPGAVSFALVVTAVAEAMARPQLAEGT
jgi:dihydroxyacetone kinase